MLIVSCNGKRKRYPLCHSFRPHSLSNRSLKSILVMERTHLSGCIHLFVVLMFGCCVKFWPEIDSNCDFDSNIVQEHVSMCILCIYIYQRRSLQIRNKSQQIIAQYHTFPTRLYTVRSTQCHWTWSKLLMTPVASLHQKCPYTWSVTSWESETPKICKQAALYKYKSTCTTTESFCFVQIDFRTCSHDRCYICICASSNSFMMVWPHSNHLHASCGISKGCEAANLVYGFGAILRWVCSKRSPGCVPWHLSTWPVPQG